MMHALFIAYIGVPQFVKSGRKKIYTCFFIEPVEIITWLNWQIAEDMRERWETSDNPVVHKIQEYATHSSCVFVLFPCYSASNIST